MKKGKVLAIDVGKRRIGLAVSDEGRRLAFPLGFLEVEGEEVAVEKIGEVAVREGVKEIVVGMPYSLKGNITPSTELAIRIAERLRERGFLVEEVDERLTTKEAEKVLGLGKGRRRKGEADKIAAVLLLQVFLDRERI
ncbi:Holliday junction resolvase RuvX [bacterium]|nr:Holliday junction resolvase RuvX [bacterium]